MPSLKVVDLSSNPSRWSEFLEFFPEAGVGHLPQWGPIIKTAYNMDSIYLAAMKGAEVFGLLPLVFIKSRLFGRALVSMPYLNDGGIIAKNDEAAHLLLTAAKELLTKENMSYLELRDTTDLNLGIPPRLEKISMVLDLRDGKDDVWMRLLHSNVRNKIRKSQKMGVTVKEGAEGLHNFYKMHVINMQELGSPAHSLVFFEEILKKFKDNIRLYVATEDGKTIGGKLVLFFGETMYFLWVSSPWEYRQYAAVSLMDWQAVEDAMERGIKFCDFGRSTAGSTHYDFKKKWGAEIKQLYWHVYPYDSNLQNTSDKKTYGKLSAIWKKLPLSVVRFLGPKLRGGLPQ